MFRLNRSLDNPDWSIQQSMRLNYSESGYANRICDKFMYPVQQSACIGQLINVTDTAHGSKIFLKPFLCMAWKKNMTLKESQISGSVFLLV